LATNTENYNLVKPDENDYYDIEIQNDNMDKIDAELKKAQDHRENTSNPHKVMADQVGAINPNLLINGDFQVWQRGTEFSGKGFEKYTADRWYIISTNGNSTTTVTKVDNGLKITQSISDAGCVAWYRMEEKDLKNIRGKTVTLSYSRDNTICTKTYTVSNDLTERDSAFFEISLPNGSTLNWVKLEIGSVATEFSPRPYAEELEICKKYYRQIIAKGLCSSWNLNALLVALNPSMRTFPTIVSVESPVTHTINTADEYGIGEVPFENPSFSYGTNEYITFISTTSTLNAGSQYSILLTLDAEIY
jgi:hypothetical protein